MLLSLSAFFSQSINRSVAVYEYVFLQAMPTGAAADSTIKAAEPLHDSIWLVSCCSFTDYPCRDSISIVPWRD